MQDSYRTNETEQVFQACVFVESTVGDMNVIVSVFTVDGSAQGM